MLLFDIHVFEWCSCTSLGLGSAVAAGVEVVLIVYAVLSVVCLLPATFPV